MSLCRQLKQSLVDMEDFLDVLKVKPEAEDGTKLLHVFQNTPEHSSIGNDQHSNGTHSNGNGNGNGTSGVRVPGLSIEFSKVQFGYTEERPVRPVCTINRSC